MSTITLIVAQDEEGGIGKGNDLPWKRISQDMKFFKSTTLKHVVIMGRKTFDSLNGKPLPDRINIVVSTQNPDDLTEVTHETVTAPVYRVDSPDKALALAASLTKKNNEIFVIGGAQIYNAFLNKANKILLTRVPGTHEADTFLNLGLDDWELVNSEEVSVKKKLVCTFEEYRQKS